MARIIIKKENSFAKKIKIKKRKQTRKNLA